MNDVYYNARNVPGVGQYSPKRQVYSAEKKNLTDYKYWVKKHNSPSPVIGRKSPGVGNYNPVEPSTF